MIVKPLGHTQEQTTAMSAPLAADPVKAAAEEGVARLRSTGDASLDDQSGPFP
jgi:hypothetical protein